MVGSFLSFVLHLKWAVFLLADESRLLKRLCSIQGSVVQWCLYVA